MRFKHHAQGKFYTIECPEGTRVVRRSGLSSRGGPGSHDLLVVPSGCEDISIPADPPELLPLLAESGRCRSLVGEPEPDVRLAGVVCPECGETDVTWLQLGSDSEAVRRDDCGANLALPVPTATRSRSQTVPAGDASPSPVTARSGSWR